MQARLLLEDGTLLVGQSFGSETEAFGEVVFHTSMTGYQDVLSDPSYCGQIITMTYPLIGNYGISHDDIEAMGSMIHGLVVREVEPVPSNWRAQYTLDQMLKEFGIPAISGVDTRMLTRKIRQAGTMKGLLTTSDAPVEELIERLRSSQLPQDLVERVSTRSILTIPGGGERIVLVDFGSKGGILRELTALGCDVVVVPHDTTAQQIRRLHPDGILLSNGPGDPKNVKYAVKMISELVEDIPFFGIGLGHQLLALAFGADTERMKFGHRGGNYPVKDLRTNRCFITTQNHGYTVKESSLAGTGLQITYINNNDGTIEGLRHERYPAFSVQYHPEAKLGPGDSSDLFEQFLQMVREHKAGRSELPKQVQFAAAYRKGELINAQK